LCITVGIKSLPLSNEAHSENPFGYCFITVSVARTCSLIASTMVCHAKDKRHDVSSYCFGPVLTYLVEQKNFNIKD